MSREIRITDELFRKFQAALMLTGEDEETVLNTLICKYANSVFENAVREDVLELPNERNIVAANEQEQKQFFVNWFRGLTRNGKAYNPVTISGYTGRIENACSDPTFASIPVNNLFTITELSDFLSIEKQIKACEGYTEFDARTHNGFTAALKKYEDFLRYQAGGSTDQISCRVPRQYTARPKMHRWTIEEDTTCCWRFLEYYVVRQSNMDTVQFLQMVSKEVPEVSEGSLRMKIQNIKYLTEQLEIRNTSTIKGLSQYSMQCEMVFYQVLRELKIQWQNL